MFFWLGRGWNWERVCCLCASLCSQLVLTLSEVVLRLGMPDEPNPLAPVCDREGGENGLSSRMRAGPTCYLKFYPVGQGLEQEYIISQKERQPRESLLLLMPLMLLSMLLVNICDDDDDSENWVRLAFFPGTLRNPSSHCG